MQSFKPALWQGLKILIIFDELGIPCKQISLICIDYVHDLCTYCLLHLLIELSTEDSGLWTGSLLEADCENLSEPYHLMEVGVVTRFQ